jgi:DNA polymerase I
LSYIDLVKASLDRQSQPPETVPNQTDPELSDNSISQDSPLSYLNIVKANLDTQAQLPETLTSQLDTELSNNFISQDSPSRYLDIVRTALASPPTIKEEVVDLASPSAAQQPEKNFLSGTELLELRNYSVEEEVEKSTFYVWVDCLDQVPGMLAALTTASHVGYDIETYGPKTSDALNPFKGTIRTAQFSTGERTWVVDCAKVSLTEFKPVLEGGPVKLIHNAKFEASFTRRKAGINIYPIIDTQLMSQILLTDLTDDRRLEAVVKKYLGEDLDKSFQKAKWGSPITEAMKAYAAKDAQVLIPLHAQMQAEITRQGLEYIMELEHRFLPMNIEMERLGVKLNCPAWEDLDIKRVAAIAVAEAELIVRTASYLSMAEVDESLASIKSRKLGSTVNWGSPDQALPLMRRLGIEVPNCDIGILEAHREDHPLMAYIIDYRVAKAFHSRLKKSTWKEYIRSDGRIHPSWNQIGATTGRMSCSDPNLQNIPKVKEYRDCIVPGLGYLFLILDYSQIEARILAEVCQDPAMLEALRQGRDLHRWVAATLLRKPYEEVAESERDWGKTMNFAIMYGLGRKSLAVSMSQALGRDVSEAEAAQHLVNYFKAFPYVKRWQNLQKRLLKLTGRWLKNKETGKLYPEEKGETVTISGRRRIVRTKQQVWNSPIQGSAADGAKEAAAILWETREEAGGAFLAILCHDEFVIEVPDNPESIAAAKNWLLQATVKGMETVLKTVPVGISEGDIVVADRWIKPKGSKPIVELPQDEEEV